MVVGMGPAGMGAALSLTALGFRVHVVERDNLTDHGAGAASTPSQVCTSVEIFLPAKAAAAVHITVADMLLNYPFYQL